MLSGQANSDQLFQQLHNPSNKASSSSSKGHTRSASAPKANDREKKDYRKSKSIGSSIMSKVKSGLNVFSKRGDDSDDAEREIEIGMPINFKRHMHIGFNPKTGQFEVRVSLLFARLLSNDPNSQSILSVS